MPIVRRAGKPDLHYSLVNCTEPWSEPPLLLLQHGYCRNGTFWYQWIPQLCGSFAVVCPDMRGLGRSGRDFSLADAMTIDELVEDLRAIVVALGDRPVHYCGESLGGSVGMAFAARYPNLVRSLALVAAPTYINEGARRGYACGYRSWPAALREMGTARWLAETNRSTRFPPDFPAAFLRWYDDTVGAAGVEMMVAIAELALAMDLRPLLPSITAPVLYLHPSGGVIANDEQRIALEEGIGSIRFHALATRFHMVHHIEPETCAGLVREHALGAKRADRTS